MVISEETIEARLRHTLKLRMSVQDRMISRDRTFSGMGCDLLDICELILDVENHFKIVLPHGHEFYEKHIVKFGDLCDYIVKQTKE